MWNVYHDPGCSRFAPSEPNPHTMRPQRSPEGEVGN